MLRTVAEILQEFANEERQKLDNFELKHGPTIGKMYEGLTSEILGRAIPEEIGLRIVSGVIYDDTGVMTGEIDCMLVEGKGVQVPYTSSFKWHIKDVICVFEVKKTLYSKDLADSFAHVRDVLSSYSRYIESGNAKGKVDLGSARKAFSMITKTIAPIHEDVGTLPLMEEMVYHTLVMEQLSPIRIVLGYHGFKSEYSFREAMFEYLEENLNKQGFGVGSFPQLIISENHSLVKGNGQPYCPPLRNGSWDFFLSSPENPAVFILELVWTRLQLKYSLGGLWGEDLLEEGFHVFLSGKIVQKEGRTSWDYQYKPIEKEILEEEYKPGQWKPVFLDQNQFVIINRLCSEGSEDVANTDFVKWLGDQNINVDSFVDSLLNTGLVAKDKNHLKLTTEECQCVILPTGEYVAAENNTGRLTRWISSRL
ncbi:hypothetical protein A3195_09865 [Candidatus Thiodiazotropha endoloripes]|uniref:DUF6602 domain-containing protein n=2 Tax=Candidatus Thiodiazotropha endoloripes TaxID=1818881 RepID=A0A1E2UQU2_9GAMM|nr:hypothetical protein A3195_09865 [Candidatus Thiodiazotropha endoloripes]ODB97089.1 hypothetical protein A3196_10115 [Candidatus Thiodiazotropha endoloripes]